MNVTHYDSGTELTFNITALENDNTANVTLLVEKFVGGGFAGQVYKVKITNIDSEQTIPGLNVDGTYAIKILIPPTNFSRLFRNTLYWVGFQGPFQLQVNPAAARAGALWQKFIRRAAQIRFGCKDSVVDIYATFVDPVLGSCGEISEWIEGRTWRLEVDENIDALRRWNKNKHVDINKLGSKEYRAKKVFMEDFVTLLHDVGAPEFARQYEWSTCKSQPNCLKRKSSGDEPDKGLVAVDFRAGLALLPFLPMSPGDFLLIYKGLKRGSLVQFDRCSLSKLQEFMQIYSEQFEDMQPMFQRLQENEDTYRNSIPDITHNHLRILYSPKLWSTMTSSAVTGWKVRNIIDTEHETSFRKSRIKAFIFLIIGIIPILGRVIRKFWARPDFRKHYINLLSSPAYFKRALKAKIAEKVIDWYRVGRVAEKLTDEIPGSPGKFFFHLPFSILPAGLHRFITDGKFRKDKLVFIFIRPVKLYFSSQLREQWLRDMVKQGQNKHILTDEDSKTILEQINEPFIQKYLKSLAVHVCTLPVTQVVSVSIAIIYVLMHPEMPKKQSWAIGAGIIAAFQVIPISPGSLVRGFYVVYMAIKDRSFKDYNIALFLGFFKYIGYLAFPIQMTYHYPALARFMAGHWATDAVHIVPVFGERGALLEHWVFCIFYNWPLTIRRRIKKRIQFRARLKPRYWHILPWVLAAVVNLAVIDNNYFNKIGNLPGLIDIWNLAFLIPLVCGVFITLGCGGAAMYKRFIAAALAGVLWVYFMLWHRQFSLQISNWPYWQNCASGGSSHLLFLPQLELFLLKYCSQTPI